MLRERGLTDLSLVVCDPWSVHMAPTDLAAGKLIQLFMYFRTEPNDNHYAHPLDFTPIVDLYQKKVGRLLRHASPERMVLSRATIDTCQARCGRTARFLGLPEATARSAPSLRCSCSPRLRTPCVLSRHGSRVRWQGRDCG